MKHEFIHDVANLKRVIATALAKFTIHTENSSSMDQFDSFF